MRFPGKTPKEQEKQESHREATYYLWVAIPVKLTLLGTLMYIGFTGDSAGGKWFLYTICLPGGVAAVVIITPFIYGLWRTVKIFAILAVIIGIFIGAATWVSSH